MLATWLEKNDGWIVMMEYERNNLGTIREKELFEALQSRFGADCVYHSPKTGSVAAQKELCDILILALPYAIVIQQKWLKLTADDFVEGEDVFVKRGRLLKRMHKAAEQYKELSSSLSHEKIITLPRVWSTTGDGSFLLPLEKVKKIVPIVIVDFEDRNYLDPELRYTDIPPVITEVPTTIRGWGVVHSFLMADFMRIVDQLFTVGDLLLWLRERNKFFTECPKPLLGYNELTLFTLYLVNNPLWKKIAESHFDAVWIDDNDCFERVFRERETEFQKRKNLFEQKNILDVLLSQMAEVASREADAATKVSPAVLDFLEYSGRIKCWPSMIKHGVAQKLIEHLKKFQPHDLSFPFLGSYGFFDDLPVSGTLYYFGVAAFNDENAETYCCHLFCRALAYIKNRGEEERFSEFLVLLTRKDCPWVCCKMFPISASDYQYASSEEQLKQTRLSFSTEEFHLSEWDMITGK